MTSQIDETFPPDQYSAARDAADPCARCDYELRGVADDQPCPECGLLAERSRSRAAHLTDATPRWLLNIAIGTGLILIAHLIAGGWAYANFSDRGTILSWIYMNMPPFLNRFLMPIDLVYGVHDAAAVILLAGVWLLTLPQRRVGRAAHEDEFIRVYLRLAATVPLLIMAWQHVLQRFSPSMSRFYLVGFTLMMVALAPLPALMFIYLRRLAKRVLHPRLAEHAAIVGVGFTLSLLMIPALSWIIESHYRRWGGASLWMLVLSLLVMVPPLLFSIWSAVNCVRFIVAFARAFRGAKRKWAAADRGVMT